MTAYQPSVLPLRLEWPSPDLEVFLEEHPGMRSKLYRAAACRPLPLRSYMFRGLLPRFHGPRRSELTLYEQLTDLSWQFRVADLSLPIAVRHPTVLEAMALMGLPEDHAFLALAYAHFFCSAPRTVDACCVQSYCYQCLPVMEALGRASLRQPCSFGGHPGAICEG